VFIRGEKTPHIRGSSVALHSSFQGIFTPHPRPLSPARGEGCHSRFPLQLKNTNSSPRPRNGGEGSGVRGHGVLAIERRSEKVERREHQNPCDSSVKIRVHPWQKKHHSSVALHSSFQGIFTPHPQPLSPARGEGCRALTQPQKCPPRQRQCFVLFVCFVDYQIPLRFIRENPCSSVAKKHPASVAHRPTRSSSAATDAVSVSPTVSVAGGCTDHPVGESRRRPSDRDESQMPVGRS